MTILPSWLLAYLLNSLWQLPLLFGAAWVVTRLLAPLGNAVQHRVWVIALLLESLLPALSSSPFPWLRYLHLWHNTSARSGGSRITITVAPGTALHVVHLSATLLTVITLLYTVVLAYLVLRFAWRACSLLRLRHEAKPFPFTASTARCWSRCSQQFHRKGVQLRTSSAIFGPITLGLRRPLILLPLTLAQTLSEDDLETVLAHELAHIERHDFLKNLIYELLALPVAFHPLLWLSRMHLTESREMVCDERAARLAGPEVYALSLLRLAASLLRGRPSATPHAIGIFDAHTLERRLMNLQTFHNQLSFGQRVLRVTLCSALAFGTCGSALALRMNIAATDKNPPPASPHSNAVPKISGGVMAGQILTRVNPIYPEAAKSAKIQGTVILRATIGKDGTIEKLQVVSGPDELRASTLDAVHQWVYKPYRLNGESTEVETTITVNYSLEP